MGSAGPVAGVPDKVRALDGFTTGAARDRGRIGQAEDLVPGLGVPGQGRDHRRNQRSGGARACCIRIAAGCREIFPPGGSGRSEPTWIRRNARGAGAGPRPGTRARHRSGRLFDRFCLSVHVPDPAGHDR